MELLVPAQRIHPPSQEGAGCTWGSPCSVLWGRGMPPTTTTTAAVKQKKAAALRRWHPHLRHILQPERLPGDFFLQPPPSMSNHFLIPAGPERGDNEISKPLGRQKHPLDAGRAPKLRGQPAAGDDPGHVPAQRGDATLGTPQRGHHSSCSHPKDTGGLGGDEEKGRVWRLGPRRAAAVTPGALGSSGGAARSLPHLARCGREQRTAWPCCSSWRKGRHEKPFPPKFRVLRHLRSDQDPLQPRARRLKLAPAPCSALGFELWGWSCSQPLRSHNPARSYSWRGKRLCRRTGPHTRLGDRHFGFLRAPGSCSPPRRKRVATAGCCRASVAAREVLRKQEEPRALLSPHSNSGDRSCSFCAHPAKKK